MAEPRTPPWQRLAWSDVVLHASGAIGRGTSARAITNAERAHLGMAQPLEVAWRVVLLHAP